MSDRSTSEDLVPEADRQEQEQVIDASAAAAAEHGLAAARRSGLSSDDEVPEADAMEQAATLDDDEEAERY